MLIIPLHLNQDIHLWHLHLCCCGGPRWWSPSACTNEPSGEDLCTRSVAITEKVCESVLRSADWIFWNGRATSVCGVLWILARHSCCNTFLWLTASAALSCSWCALLCLIVTSADPGWDCRKGSCQRCVQILYRLSKRASKSDVAATVLGCRVRLATALTVALPFTFALGMVSCLMTTRLCMHLYATNLHIYKQGYGVWWVCISFVSSLTEAHLFLH